MRKCSHLGCLIPLTVVAIFAACFGQSLSAADALAPKGPKLSEQFAEDSAYFYAADGERFSWERWLPKSETPKGVVVAIHGMNGAASEFSRLGTLLTQENVAVYAPNLRGGGLDPVVSRP